MHPWLPLITISIPTYNRANNYLPQSLTSALRQTYRNIEIIVADNCSTDHTATLVKEYSDSRLRYFRHEKNIGANNNFNFCLQQARGTYLLFLHDDDLIDPDFVESCMKTIKYGEDIGLVRTGMRVIDAAMKIIRVAHNVPDGTSTDSYFLSWFKGKIPMYCCNTLFHTEKLLSIGGFNSEYNLLQDVKAEVQLVAKFGRKDVQDIKASTRAHEQKYTRHTRVIDWCRESLILLDLMCDLVSENKELIRSEGMRFFAKISYRRAMEVRSLDRRLLSYLIVFRQFRYKYPPPPLSRFLHLQGKLRQLPGWIPAWRRSQRAGARRRQ